MIYDDIAAAAGLISIVYERRIQYHDVLVNHQTNNRQMKNRGIKAFWMEKVRRRDGRGIKQPAGRGRQLQRLRMRRGK